MVDGVTCALGFFSVRGGQVKQLIGERFALVDQGLRCVCRCGCCFVSSAGEVVDGRGQLRKLLDGCTTSFGLGVKGYGVVKRHFPNRVSTFPGEHRYHVRAKRLGRGVGVQRALVFFDEAVL